MTKETKKEELDFLEWTRKLCERINTVHVCLTDKRKMNEADYDVMEELYYFWDYGSLPFYHHVADFKNETVTQSDLFTGRTDTTTDKPD